MHVTIIENKQGLEFEREQAGLCGRVWSEEREWGNNVLINS